MSIYRVHPFKDIGHNSPYVSKYHKGRVKKKTLTPRDYVELEDNFTYLDLWLNFISRQRCLENPDLFELDCTHGIDCQVKNECHCTAFEECSANDDKRDEELKVSRKTLHRNVRRRIGYQEPQPEQSPLQQPFQQERARKERAYDNFENFAGEFFRQ